ncbi:MAG TPA: sugar phosphate isomerase/epimerase [Candidatus Limnocylindrales bacterium]|nr:sugar phosphate isomerase/epimerase [Candidatus Limnocylindrales bacterium]
MSRGLHLNGATIMTTDSVRHLEVARRAGYAGVELRAERLLAAPDEVRAAGSHATGGEVWSLNGVRITLRSDGTLDRETLEADLGPRLDVCRAVGAAYLLAVPPRLPGVDRERALAGVREGLRLAADRAADAGIGVAFEFLGFFDCPIDSPALAGRAVEGLAGVDLVLDSCHWHASGSQSLDGFPVERLRMVHLNDAPAKDPDRVEDADRLLPGEGVIALPSLVSQLAARSYRGPWSLETFNPAHWRADPLAVAEEGRARLRALLGPLADGTDPGASLDGGEGPA